MPANASAPAVPPAGPPGPLPQAEPSQTVPPAWERLLFGHLRFSEDQDYLGFRYRFLCGTLVFGAVATAVLLVGSWLGPNLIGPAHQRMMGVFTLLTVALWLLLRNHASHFHRVAWAYAALSLVELGSALVNVRHDELRLIWFFTMIPSTYLLLGRRAGAGFTAVLLAMLVLLNPHLAQPYSAQAMPTAIVGMLYTAVIFHLYSARSVSYFQRMRRANARLRALATRDPLTGVLNARGFQEQADGLLAHCHRQSEAASILFVDLDHFKRINDERGHAAGDAVLQAVARCLARHLRASDAVGRVGGEEFCVVLPATPVAAALQVAQALRSHIEQLRVEVEGPPCRVTASIGVAGAPAGVSLAQAQRQADQAMYRAKAGGRNRVSLLDEGVAPPLDLVHS